MIRRICVFCGSSPGANPAYAAGARALADVLVHEGIGLVYGGGNVGIMGVLANAVLEAGGEVTGVIPQTLWEREVGHAHLSDLRVVGSMHERKALMSELADAFVALPGGLGTLEEFFEIWTWGQLGLHEKPFGLLNVAGYYDPLIAFLDHMVAERFVNAAQRAMMVAETDPGRLLERLRGYVAPEVEKWLDRDGT